MQECPICWEALCKLEIKFKDLTRRWDELHERALKFEKKSQMEWNKIIEEKEKTLKYPHIKYD